MARRTPSAHDRRAGYMSLLFRRTINRLGFNLGSLPEAVLHGLWEAFLDDLANSVRHRDLWPRFDARLDQVLGPRFLAHLLRRKRTDSGGA